MWSPNIDGLSRLISVLNDFQSHDNLVQKNALTQLESFTHSVPDYYCYLAFIFTQQDQPVILRNLAGLTLKRNIINHYKAIQGSDVMVFVKESALAMIADKDESIRNTSGSIITTIVSYESWPEVIGKLVELMDHQNTLIAEVKNKPRCESKTMNANHLSYAQSIAYTTSFHLTPIVLPF